MSNIFNPSAGGGSDPNWTQIATGTQSSGTTTIMNLTSLANYRSIRGWFTYPEAASGNSSMNYKVNGLTGNYYRNMHQKWLGNSASWSGIWSGSAGGTSWNGENAFVQFQIDFLAQGYQTTDRAVIVGNFNIFSYWDQSNAANGSWDQTHFMYNEPLTSNTGITALNVYMGASTAQVASGYPSFYVEGFTAS